jgi:hypothetical protein
MEINSNQHVVSTDNIDIKHIHHIHNSDDNRSNIINKNYKTYFLEGVGWIGSILVLIPYVVPFNKTVDFVLNTLGASGLFVVCVTSRQYQSIVINAAWIVGGIYKYFS